MKIQKLTQCISLTAASLALSGAVFAADMPTQLNDTQLDKVTAGATYISYGALKRNYIPGRDRNGPTRGVNSKPVNSYTRGCSAVTRCARS